MIDTIDSPDWGLVPGPANHYRPATVRDGLQGLTRARGHTDAASAASLLAGGGIIHDHSGTVLPSAVPATPILLQIAEEGCNAAQAAALELIEDALDFRPWPGFARTRDQVRLCCAIADHVHARAPALARFGDRSRSLLRAAREHWRLDIEETYVEGTDTLVFGTATGSLPRAPQAAELHAGGDITRVSTLIMEYPAIEGHAQVCVRLADTKLPETHSSARLYNASCGE
ncbi:hypothetical protein KIK06_15360 [Nocardiopsis sp. EMB25]|uniref:hypothetical protein n=1 Tax=Nocardiopsis sp. EMB25 TaxID=2835867 RepID=UPI002284F434|nr:hypothetical protein [Nocardiopsis sp. EMB25]MCY9785260.1 hypothetical protein [Nocardiopsis sp. EMB25]